MYKYLITVVGDNNPIEIYGSRYDLVSGNFNGQTGLVVFDSDENCVFQCVDYSSIRITKLKQQ